MATPKYDSMPEYREALGERARGLDGLLEPLRSEALQLTRLMYGVRVTG